MKKYRFFTFVLLITTLALGVPSAVLAEIGDFDEDNGRFDARRNSNELPNLHEEKILQNLTIYNTQDVGAECKNTLALLLTETPPALLPSYLNIELHSVPTTEFHGLAAANTIKLNCNLPTSRLREVFYHELGHVHYDSIAQNPENPFAKKMPKYNAAGAPNFLTEYATTNEHEDFAESFAMYFTNRELFETKAEKSKILTKKYEFLERYAM